MSTSIRHLTLLAAVGLVGLAGTAAAADRPYTEGPVSIVTAIRTENGMWDDYLAFVATSWKTEMDAAKQAGLIVGYAVYSTVPRNPNEPDLYLVVTYKNFAAFDGLSAKMDAITEKFSGSLQKANAETTARGKIRKILGDEMIQQLILK
ncbi:MAG TPA: hypothetical protein VMT17_16870 [Anaeromyxobacteraceae bacterium]|nr:hypothetical protein [Anaeromyxobacteraceae bacterium]